MRKIVIIVMALMVTFLSACSNPFVLDKNHATVTINQSNGKVAIFETYNGLNMSCSGQTAATRRAVTFELKKGESLQYSFKCDTCGYVEEGTIDYPSVKVLSCRCDEKGDENGNAREYFDFHVTFSD